MGEERNFVGARLDAGLRAARFSSPPSADEFEADVEPKNIPAVIVLPYVLLKFCFRQVLICPRVVKIASSGLSRRG
jgi:hypothetical protein